MIWWLCEVAVIRRHREHPAVWAYYFVCFWNQTENTTLFTNGVHLDLMDLKAKGKLTRINSTNLLIMIIVSRQN